MKRPIRKTVYKILREDEYARKNDCYLIMRVVQELEPDLAGTSFVSVMEQITYRGISFEGITRARRKFFEENPGLKNAESEQARREKEEEYFVEYSNHIPRID